MTYQNLKKENKTEEQIRQLEEGFENNDKKIKALELKTDNLLPKEFMKHTHVGGDYARVNMKDLTGTVTRHVIIDPTRFKIPAANYPSEGFEGIFYTLDFDKATDESAYCIEHIPYRWDKDTSIEVEVFWLHDSVDTGVVVWGVEYLGIKDGETVDGSSVTTTQASAGTHTAGELVSTKFTTKILYTNLEVHDMLALRFYRDANHASDTLDEDARIINVCFHFTMNKLGKK